MSVDYVIVIVLLTLAVASIGFVAGVQWEKTERGE